MQEVILKLQEWQTNIEYDAVTEHAIADRYKLQMLQSTKIAMAVGLLQSIGNNNNIPQ